MTDGESPLIRYGSVRRPMTNDELFLIDDTVDREPTLTSRYPYLR